MVRNRKGWVYAASALLMFVLAGCPFPTGSDDSGGSGNSGGGVVAAPALSIGTGRYIGAQTVSVTNNTGGTVYYRRDGEIPTTADTAYSGPIMVGETSTLTFKTISGSAESNTVFASYAIFPDEATLNSGNQITNGTFEAGIGAWYYVALDSWGSSVTTFDAFDADTDGDNELRIVIGDDGTAIWNVQVVWAVGQPIAEGDLIEVTLTGWIDGTDANAMRPFRVVLDDSGNDVDGDDDTFEWYYITPEQYLDTTPRSFTFRIPVYYESGYSDDTARFVFNVGEFGLERNTDTVYFDDVTFTKVASPAAASTLISSTDFLENVLDEVQKIGDVNNDANRFQSAVLADLTEFHLALVDRFDLDGGEDPADIDYIAPGEFDMDDIALLPNVKILELETTPMDTAAMTTLGTMRQLRRLIVTDYQNGGVVPAPTEIGNLRLLQELQMYVTQGGIGDATTDVDEITDLVSPTTFPRITRLGMGWSSSPTGARLTNVIAEFAAYVTDGTLMERVYLKNVAIDGAAFDALYSDVLDPSKGVLNQLELENATIQSDELADISNLPGIHTLRLRWNSIDDMSEVADMTAIDLIDLRGNSITDITPLNTLLAAGGFSGDNRSPEVDLDSNPFDPAATMPDNAGTISALVAAGVDVDF